MAIGKVVLIFGLPQIVVMYLYMVVIHLMEIIFFGEIKNMERICWIVVLGLHSVIL